MKKILLVLMFATQSAFAAPPTDGGIESPEKSMVVITSPEQRALKEINKTTLQSRIVKIRIKKRKNKTHVYITWHPRTTDDVTSDVFLIVKSINNVLPRFYSITLKAIDPAYMRWSGRIFWNTVIKRKAIVINRFIDRQPQPLYQ